jgi:hypothetical protein
MDATRGLARHSKQGNHLIEHASAWRILRQPALEDIRSERP